LLDEICVLFVGCVKFECILFCQSWPTEIYCWLLLKFFIIKLAKKQPKKNKHLSLTIIILVLWCFQYVIVSLFLFCGVFSMFVIVEYCACEVIFLSFPKSLFYFCCNFVVFIWFWAVKLLQHTLSWHDSGEIFSQLFAFRIVLFHALRVFHLQGRRLTIRGL
jgi:hypothetical protein